MYSGISDEDAHKIFEIQQKTPQERQARGENDAYREGVPLLPQDDFYMAGWNKALVDVANSPSCNDNPDYYPDRYSPDYPGGEYTPQQYL